MDIKSLLRTKQSMLEANLKVLLDHPTTKGDHCEGAWIDFFRSFLPSRYSVDKGFVFDSKGNISEQIDIIIYDSLYSPLIFGTESGEKFITSESVYAVFDSKPNIDKENLEYTDKKIESVLRLHRTSRKIINAGVEQCARNLTSIFGGILAIDSITAKNIEKHLKTYKNIKLGCAIKDITFISYQNETSALQYSTGDDIVLSFFYLILNELYKQGTVAAIDIREYANASLDNLKIL